MKKLVTGAGGFIGGHLVKRLLDDGHDVIGVDVKPFSQWWQRHRDHPRASAYDAFERFDAAGDRIPELQWFRTDHNLVDLRFLLTQVDDIYHLAENMGGIGFIESNRVACLNSVLTTVNLLALTDPLQHKFFYASSACAYSRLHQERTTVWDRGQTIPAAHALREDDAWPAMPEEGYGLEKLYCEKLCEWYHREVGLDVRVVRFHNSYGPFGSWNDGREKAPAALCRKVARADADGSMTISIWGDGKQTRSFMFIDDNIEGIIQLMKRGNAHPVNLGSSQLVSVDQLVDTIELHVFGGLKLTRIYEPTAPRGVPGRNSDNGQLRRMLKWEPKTTLAEGIAKMYPWIDERVKQTWQAS